MKDIMTVSKQEAQLMSIDGITRVAVIKRSYPKVSELVPLFIAILLDIVLVPGVVNGLIALFIAGFFFGLTDENTDIQYLITVDDDVDMNQLLIDFTITKTITGTNQHIVKHRGS